MLSEAEKAYCQALSLLKERDYNKALDFFEKAQTAFGTNSEFILLYESTRLLVSVKEELAKTNLGASVEKKELIING